MRTHNTGFNAADLIILGRIISTHHDLQRSINEQLLTAGPQIIREILARDGISLRRLSRLAKRSPAYISSVRCGRCTISEDTYLALARILDAERT